MQTVVFNDGGTGDLNKGHQMEYTSSVPCTLNVSNKARNNLANDVKHVTVTQVVLETGY